MNKNELKKLISKGETQEIEFKESPKLEDEIGQEVSAFSNTNSGKVFVGVTDSKEVIGVQIGKNTLENLANYIKRNTDPQIYPLMKVEKVDGKDIIVIEIKESREKPVFFKGKAYKRVGKSSHELSSSEIRKLAKETAYEKTYWDEQICEEASLKDIDEEKVRWFLMEARKQRNLKILEDTSVKDALVQLKLLRTGKPTNAVMLLFAKKPKFIQSEIKCIRFKGNKPVKPYIDFQTIEGSVLDLVDMAEDFVLRNIKKAIWLVPGKIQREEKYEYPPEAIREAIVNAVAHRDYLSPSKVQVRVFDDRIEIWNPGKLPEGWSIEKLKQKHESIPKNPLLFKQLFWVKYVEDVGGGTLDMIKKCREWGILEPEFEDTGTSIIVTFLKSKLTDEFIEKLGLNERQKEVIDFLKEHKKITRLDYEERFSTSERTANRELLKLVSMGILKKKGKGPEVYYILSEISPNLAKSRQAIGKK